jgi:hypothetical protein
VSSAGYGMRTADMRSIVGDGTDHTEHNVEKEMVCISQCRDAALQIRASEYSRVLYCKHSS